MGTHRDDQDDQNGKRNRTKLPTVEQTVYFIQTTIHSGENVQPSQADFFDRKGENCKSAADIWKRRLEIEKNCGIENVAAAELLASKFLSLIGS